jgi:hypothetical protein
VVDDADGAEDPRRGRERRDDVEARFDANTWDYECGHIDSFALGPFSSSPPPL